MSFANLKSNKTDVSKLVSAAQSLSGGGDKKKSTSSKAQQVSGTLKSL